MIKEGTSKVVLSCPVFDIEETEVELANGDQHSYLYVCVPDGVGIIAIDADNNILLTRQLMAATNALAWRIPMGDIDSGETHEEAARRELREETGLDAKHLEYVTSETLASNWLKHTTHFFIARDLFDSPLDTEFFEEIDVTPTSVEDAQALIDTHQFSFDVPTGLSAAILKLKSTI